MVGWDGYVWPYAFNADDFEPRAGRFHLPAAHPQTFQGPNFVICTFAPRMAPTGTREAVTLPYHHSNIQSEEVMFYAEGDYAARKGVEIGCITLRRAPARAAAFQARWRRPSAPTAPASSVMWDTFRPLRLTALWREIDKPEYALSWNPDKARVEA